MLRYVVGPGRRFPCLSNYAPACNFARSGSDSSRQAERSIGFAALRKSVKPEELLLHRLKGHEFLQFQRSLGLVPTGGGDVNEMYIAAANCKNKQLLKECKGKPNLAWFKAWDDLAERTFQAGMQRLADQSNPAGAASALLRACNYSRTSAFFLRGHVEYEEEKREAYLRTDQAFRSAAAVLKPSKLEEVRIPLNGSDTNTNGHCKITLQGYFGRASFTPNGFEHSPLLIASSGYDGDIAETFFYVRPFIEKFGFNILIFDGPGQGVEAVTRKTKLIPNWEIVLKAVIDYAEQNLKEKGVDVKRDGLVSYGISLGGHLNTRAMLHEKRVHCYVLDPINPSMRRAMFEKLPKKFINDMLDSDASPDDSTKGLSCFSNFLKTLIEKFMFQALASRAQVHGIDVTDKAWLAQFVREAYRFHLDYEELGKATVSMVLCAAENDVVVGDMSKPEKIMKYFSEEMVTEGKIRVIPFLKSEGAGNHCEGGARELVWERVLDELLPLLGKEVRKRGQI
uniref:AB hydrolase-1 domain-containing protein n=1 Tax=Chromera velia CCMP2878 TaxID=1169474 RepID=A0A0G4GJD2_9ALVE|eukprot:Cvel_4797.t1-p1 / transcript=Cvel_4797.t1 / gene=Cvel_4797 / organism=Chromera_velia_CCMP2878 / gene_product=hypothetical protein / transcript_product=hypothetical protein / location=Cvel_scaffold214:74301-75827(+) / protein_length=509 / sequence_SO=supercontig / SO=protein_coding / is_pseudo=false